MRDSSCESSVVAGLHEQTHPPAYKTRNWTAYNEALKRRGSLSIWFDPAMTWEAAPNGKRGRPPDYSGEEGRKQSGGLLPDEPDPDLPDDESSVRHGAQADDGLR